MSKDVIFIGAGPIGLLAAIQLKLSSPTLSILMFEKYPVPKRNHNMYVNPSVFSGMNRDKGFGELLDGIDKKITISDLETQLRLFAAKMGIEIEYKQVESVDALKHVFPDTKYIVGSGGIKGVVHPQIFDKENQIEHVLRYAAEVKYRAVGKTESLSKLTQLPGVHLETNNLVSEYVGNARLEDIGGEEREVTPVSLRIFVDKDVYESMKEASFANPYTLSETDATHGINRIYPSLLETIQVYLSARKNLAHERILDGSLKIGMINLSFIASKDFCKQLDDGRVIFKIGEEAFACPYFRSFNDNATCVMPFVRALLKHQKIQLVDVREKQMSSFAKISSSLSASDPLDDYRYHYNRLIRAEYPTIRIIDSGLSAVHSSVETSRALPVLRKVANTKLRMTEGGDEFIAEQRARREQQQAHDDSSRSKSKCVIV